MNETKARQLVDRYFEGATTLQEEQKLYAFFTSEHISAELKPLRQMFLDMYQLQGCEPAPQAKVVSLKSRSRWRHIAIAAAVVATAGIVTAVWLRPADDCEMVAYGQRLTDREAVMHEVERTLTDAQSATPDVGSELRDAFGQYDDMH